MISSIQVQWTLQTYVAHTVKCCTYTLCFLKAAFAGYACSREQGVHTHTGCWQFQEYLHTDLQDSLDVFQLNVITQTVGFGDNILCVFGYWEALNFWWIELIIITFDKPRPRNSPELNAPYKNLGIRSKVHQFKFNQVHLLLLHLSFCHSYQTCQIVP